MNSIIIFFLYFTRLRVSQSYWSILWAGTLIITCCVVCKFFSRIFLFFFLLVVFLCFYIPILLYRLSMHLHHTLRVGSIMGFMIIQLMQCSASVSYIYIVCVLHLSLCTEHISSSVFHTFFIWVPGCVVHITTNKHILTLICCLRYIFYNNIL